jgi:hypothetical protein
MNASRKIAEDAYASNRKAVSMRQNSRYNFSYIASEDEKK